MNLGAHLISMQICRFAVERGDCMNIPIRKATEEDAEILSSLSIMHLV
jgi:hypothetical protein